MPKPKKSNKRPVKTPSTSRPPKRAASAVFDVDARREYLTGFSKRKKQRADAARKKAEDREKQELRETRALRKKQRLENAKESLRQAGAYIPSDDDDDENNDSGSSDATPQTKSTDQLYNDDSLNLKTTVTVEELNLNQSENDEDEEEPFETKSALSTSVPQKQKLAPQKRKQIPLLPKKKSSSSSKSAHHKKPSKRKHI